MFNAKNLLGALMNGGMSQSSGRRLEHSLGDKGVGGQNGILGQMLSSVTGGSGGSGGGGLLGSLGNIAGSMFGNKQSNTGGMGTAGAGALGALAGSLFGGGSSSVKGALGGGALAMLGSLALQAYKNYSAQGSNNTQPDASSQLMAGLRQPENDQEQQEVQDVAMLTLKAMINAAKADGNIDEQETQRILGKLQEGGITSEEQQFVIDEMKKPMDTDNIVNAVPNPQVGAQIYAASLLAIEIDTDAERDYMQQLANRLGLDNNVVTYLHSAVGAS